MLESEAKTKLCPFTSGASSIGGSHYKCEGSKCMAWQALAAFTNIDEDGKAHSHGAKEPPEGACGLVHQMLYMPPLVSHDLP